MLRDEGMRMLDDAAAGVDVAHNAISAALRATGDLPPRGCRKGAHLDGIRTLDELMGRCFVDADTGCWHLRSGRGKPMPKGRTAYVWLHGRGMLSAKRVAWEFRHQRRMPDDRVARITCTSHDCIFHVAAVTRAQLGAAQRKSGELRGMAHRCVANALVNAPRKKVADEQVLWALESEQHSKVVAHALGCSGELVRHWRAGIRRRAVVMGASRQLQGQGA